MARLSSYHTWVQHEVTVGEWGQSALLPSDREMRVCERGSVSCDGDVGRCVWRHSAAECGLWDMSMSSCDGRGQMTVQ